MVRNQDPATQTTTVPLVGTSLQLGENENDGGGRDGRDQRQRHDDDD
ncbi:MAG: hypothetical protein SFZ23_07945 [Planctomycetota bacterium]|nr:hypothetical protein [Planctomycetota bacterium]